MFYVDNLRIGLAALCYVGVFVSILFLPDSPGLNALGYGLLVALLGMFATVSLGLEFAFLFVKRWLSDRVASSDEAKPTGLNDTRDSENHRKLAGLAICVGHLALGAGWTLVGGHLLRNRSNYRPENALAIDTVIEVLAVIAVVLIVYSILSHAFGLIGAIFAMSRTKRVG
jgi:asparagine N-glycosylation enzyme membrane subunit Stt3